MSASSSQPNYYEILNVRRDSTSRDIREAFKYAALRSHPDKPYRDYPYSFVVVRHAAGVLLDARSRAAYDASVLQVTIRLEGRISDTVCVSEFAVEVNEEETLSVINASSTSASSGASSGWEAVDATATLECRCGGEYTVLVVRHHSNSSSNTGEEEKGPPQTPPAASHSFHWDLPPNEKDVLAECDCCSLLIRVLPQNR